MEIATKKVQNIQDKKNELTAKIKDLQIVIKSEEFAEFCINRGKLKEYEIRMEKVRKKINKVKDDIRNKRSQNEGK